MDIRDKMHSIYIESHLLVKENGLANFTPKEGHFFHPIIYNFALSQIQFLISLYRCIYQTSLEDMKKSYLLTELFWKIHDIFNFYHQPNFFNLLE